MANALVRTVRALIERDPTAFMAAPRDGRGHVLAAVYHRDFTLGLDHLELRQAFATMPAHHRRVWMAVEIGVYLDAEVTAGVVTTVERFTEPMTVHQCASYYGFTVGTVEAYLKRANAHLRSALDLPRTRARPPWHAVRDLVK